MENEIIDRLDSFLAKIKIRFEEALAFGEIKVLESLEENEHDYYGSFRTLKAIQSQIYNDLINKVDSTWQHQIEPLLRGSSVNWTAELKKCHHFSEKMKEELSLWQFVTEGKLALKYYDHAIQLINQNFLCSQCNAPLTIKKNFFMAQYVVCIYCNTVNTFEPETKYVTIGWNVIDNIAALRSLEEYKSMLRDKGGRYYAKSQRRYYERFFDERISLMPHTATTREKDIELALKKQSN